MKTPCCGRMVSISTIPIKWTEMGEYQCTLCGGIMSTPVFAVSGFPLDLKRAYNGSEYLIEGTKVYKPKGYQFPSTIVSVFQTLAGEDRVVAEMDEYRMLHIFNPKQLRKV